MSLKFGKNREVTTGYAFIPIFYTGIKHPHNKNKELVLMDKIGKYYTACWKNMENNRCGIQFLVKAIDAYYQKDARFIYKDKVHKLGSMVW